MKRGEKFRRLLLVSILLVCVLIFINISASYAKKRKMLNKGDYIKFGNYYGEDILWRVLKVEGENESNRAMLVSDKIITLKAFDASKTANLKYSNNKWEESNIRDWLNSESTPKLKDYEWTHAKPSKPFNNWNNYSEESGFLLDFIEDEKEMLIKMDDKGNINDTGNKVTLLTNEELPLLIEAGYVDYRAKPTKKAVINNNYDGSSLSKDNYWYYWTRTPCTDEVYLVYRVDEDGEVKNNYACYGHYGVRPVVWVDTSNITLDSADGDTEETAYDIKSYILDKEKPEIINTKLEENIMKDTIYGEEQIREGITANDNIDGDITSSIKVSGDTVNTNRVGKYTIRYNVTDDAGNIAEEVTRVVYVTFIYEGYEIGTMPKDRKYFKYYVGLDKRGEIRCMLVCAEGKDNNLKRLYTKEDIIDVNTCKFKNCYYIDKEGKIKKYFAN